MSSFYDNITNQREKIHALSDMNMNAKYTCSLNENTGNSYYYGFPEVDSRSLLETELECLDRLEDCLIPFTDKMAPLIQKAETINPIGLTINPVKPISQGDCSDCNADAIAALKSSDADKINDSIEKIANPADFFSNTIVDMKACSLNSVEESCKKATKADIEEAAKKIKNGKKKLSSLKDKASKKIQSKKYKVENLKEEIDKASRVVLHDDNEKEKCSKVSECCLAAICIENEDLHNYIAAVKERTQFLNEMKSSINIIITSALYNPRDIKNTLVFSEMAGSIVSYNFGAIAEQALDYTPVQEAQHLFGMPIDYKKLDDPDYVRELTKKNQRTAAGRI